MRQGQAGLTEGLPPLLRLPLQTSAPGPPPRRHLRRYAHSKKTARKTMAATQLDLPFDLIWLVASKLSLQVEHFSLIVVENGADLVAREPKHPLRMVLLQHVQVEIAQIGDAQRPRRQTRTLQAAAMVVFSPRWPALPPASQTPGPV